MTGPAKPLILTAQLPRDLHAYYTQLRTEHFPPERNRLQAHVTLFHAVPALFEAEISMFCKRLVAEFSPVEAQVQGLMSLDGGTAIRLQSDGMLALRDLIAERLHGQLTAQDQHRPRLHVTIQNKVGKAEAGALQRLLADKIELRTFAFPGLSLFRYLGGPWEPIATFRFRGHAKA